MVLSFVEISKYLELGVNRILLLEQLWLEFSNQIHRNLFILYEDCAEATAWFDVPQSSTVQSVHGRTRHTQDRPRNWRRGYCHHKRTEDCWCSGYEPGSCRAAILCGSPRGRCTRLRHLRGSYSTRIRERERERMYSWMIGECENVFFHFIEDSQAHALCHRMRVQGMYLVGVPQSNGLVVWAGCDVATVPRPTNVVDSALMSLKNMDLDPLSCVPDSYRSISSYWSMIQ